MNKKLNILMVAESFYPDGIGGEHTYIYNLARTLAGKGHYVYVLTVKTKKEAASEEDIEGIHVLRYNSALSGNLLYIRRPFLSVVNTHILFNKIIKKVQFDIINCHTILPTFGIISCLGSKNISKIYTFHSSLYRTIIIQKKKKKYSSFFLDNIISLTAKFVEKINLKCYKKIIVLSDFSKQYILDTYHEDPNKIVVIPGGVDSEKFAPIETKSLLREDLFLPKNKIILVTARRLIARMGLENLVVAMKSIVKEIDGAILIILGDGFLKEELKLMIKNEGLGNNVKLLGFIDFEKIPLYYQASDIFILPSEHDEWFGLVTLEALACGLPVLATPVGATGEILGKFRKNMIFTGVRPEDISKGVIDFVKARKTLPGLSVECRRFVLDNYSWEKTCESIEEVYFSLLKNKIIGIEHA